MKLYSWVWRKSTLPILLMMMVLERSHVNGGITYEALPTSLEQCFHRLYFNKHSVKDTAEAIASTCLLNYVWKHVAVRCYNYSEASLEYIGRLLLPYYHEQSRHKRSTPRVRKEYRSLTEDERNLFHTALNELKADTSETPNAYDVIAQYHNEQVGGAAHGGPAFLPWHRVYLLLMEDALRRKQPNVTIPYWDCGLDSNINPRNSIMWSNDFMGSVSGAWWDDTVQDGPVQSWNIERYLGGAGGQLINDAMIEELLAIENSTEFASLLEQYHNNAHVWVGGNMLELVSAPFDPIFFMLHGFIDYIWWQWQTNNRQRSFTWEYPFTTIDSIHAQNQPVMNLQINGTDILNGDAFNQTWAFEYFQYEKRPSCVPGSQTCTPPNMGCTSTISGSTVCASATSSNSNRRKRDIYAVRRHNKWMSKRYGAHQRGKSKGKRKTRSNVRTTRKRQKSSLQVKQSKENVEVHILGSIPPITKKPSIPLVSDYIHDNKAKKTDIHYRKHQGSGLGLSIQNSFEINCEADSRLWVYMPFKVVHLRSQGSIYHSHLVSNGRIIDQRDMFSGQMYKSLRTCIKPETPISYGKCKADDSGFFKVIVSSYGLNYHGNYKDFVILDNRQAVDGKIGYIAFKRPDNKSSKFILTAFDECGRICTPKCRIPGSSPPQYKPCSGVLDIDSKKPRRYSDTYGEAVLRYWDFRKGACPTAQEGNIDIVFYCEYKNKWFPWYH